MRSSRRAGLGLRLLGIAVSVVTAGALLAADISYDRRSSASAGTLRSDMKQAYRRQAGVLTCSTPFNPVVSPTPPPLKQIVIPEPQARGPFFSFAAIDAVVDDDDCKLDISPQTIWIAIHAFDLTPPIAADARQTMAKQAARPAEPGHRRGAELARNGL